MDKLIKLKETTHKELIESFHKRKFQSGLVPSEYMKDTKFSVFQNYYFIEEWYLHNIINLVEWGSNRVIRQQGFRILPITMDLIPIKQWALIRDPYYIIKESIYISKPKGQSIIVIHIGELPL